MKIFNHKNIQSYGILLLEYIRHPLCTNNIHFVAVVIVMLFPETANSRVRGEVSQLTSSHALLSAHAAHSHEVENIVQEFARRIRGRIDVLRSVEVEKNLLRGRREWKCLRELLCRVH